MSELLTETREAGLGAVAGSECDYCRCETGDCRPMPVWGREYVPKLCDNCYCELRDAERLDHQRDKLLFYMTGSWE